MKNVAKCDTWCELQNPVNHRVFERKLRPKPFGRGHVCLGVTQRRPQTQRSLLRETSGGTETGLPWRHTAVGRISSPGTKSHNNRWLEDPRSICCGVFDACNRAKDPSARRLLSRPQVRRDYPLSLSISISGGKETYQDSPSNGERTGKRPA